MIVMVKNNSYLKAIPVLAAFFVMGFCDIVGISSDYMQKNFNWSPTMTGFVPSMVFIWFLFLGIPVGNRMSKYGRKTKEYSTRQYGGDSGWDVFAIVGLQ